MKLIILILVSVMTSLSAMAGGKTCVATGINFPPSSIPFTLDWGVPNGTVISFSQKIAWYEEALNFNVIFTGMVGNTYLVVARWEADEKAQLVEIHFENNHMEKGSLKAGDSVFPMAELGKFQEYTIECR